MEDRGHFRSGTEPGLFASAFVPDLVCGERAMNKSRLLMSLCLCAGRAACSSAQVAKEEASELIEQGQYEAGLARIEEGLRENPRDTELHIALNSARARAITALLTQTDMGPPDRDFAPARRGYAGVLTTDPTTRRAQAAMRADAKSRWV